MSKESKSILGGVLWKFAERVFSQGVSFVVSVVLARLLMPEEYGIVAIVNIFLIFASVFVTEGFAASLIQKKDADEVDFSTIFYCTLAVSLVMYAIVFVAAPYIALFYKMPDLCMLTRVYGLSLVIMSYQTVQLSYVSRHMVFKKNFFATFFSTVISGAVGIYMAFCNYGVWALVAQYLSNLFMNTVTLMFVVPWKPKLCFSFSRARLLMSFGSKILIGSVITTVYKEIRQLIIGKVYTPTDLALYNRGDNLPKMVRTNVDVSIRTVLFPAMSNHSDNPEAVKAMLRKGIKISSFICFYFFTIMAVMAPSLVNILLTEKWSACVPYMQIFCIAYMFDLISGYNIEALKALGKGTEVLKLDALKKPVFLIVILIASKFSVWAIAVTSPINSLYGIYMNMRPTRKYLKYDVKSQLMDFLPSFLLALFMVVVTLPIRELDLCDWQKMLFQFLGGTFFYISMSFLFKVEGLLFIKNKIQEVCRARRGR